MPLAAGDKAHSSRHEPEQTTVNLRRLIARRLPLLAKSWYVRDILFPFIITRAILIIIGVSAMARMPANSPGTPYYHRSSVPWIDLLSHWDGRWYLHVVELGYNYTPGTQCDVAFSPLLPFCMNLGSFFFGQNGQGRLLAGIVTANTALLIGLAYLATLVRLDFSHRVARRTVLYVLVFPTTIFLSSVYPMSLMLALDVAAFYYARRGNWWTSSLLGSLSVLAHPDGVILFAPLVAECLSQHKGNQPLKKPFSLPLSIYIFMLIPATLLLWMAVLYILVGNPVAFLSVQSAWGRHLAPPWELFYKAQDPFDVGFALLGGIMVFACWRLLRPSYTLLMALSYLPIISSGTLMSGMRLELAFFPMFIALAIIGCHVTFDRMYTLASCWLGGYFTVLISLWYWLA